MEELLYLAHVLKGDFMNDILKNGQTFSLEKTNNKNINLWLKGAKENTYYLLEVRFSDDAKRQEVLLIDHNRKAKHNAELFFTDVNRKHVVVNDGWNTEPNMLFLEKDDGFPSLYRSVKIDRNEELEYFLNLYADHAIVFFTIIWETNPFGCDECCLVWRDVISRGYHCCGIFHDGFLRKQND